MGQTEDSIIREIVDTIVRDVDLLIVENEPFGPVRSCRKETARLYLALRQLTIANDLLLYSRDALEKFKYVSNHIIGRAQREGKVVHARTLIR